MTSPNPYGTIGNGFPASAASPTDYAQSQTMQNIYPDQQRAWNLLQAALSGQRLPFSLNANEYEALLKAAYQWGTNNTDFDMQPFINTFVTPYVSRGDSATQYLAQKFANDYNKKTAGQWTIDNLKALQQRKDAWASDMFHSALREALNEQKGQPGYDEYLKFASEALNPVFGADAGYKPFSTVSALSDIADWVYRAATEGGKSPDWLTIKNPVDVVGTPGRYAPLAVKNLWDELVKRQWAPRGLAPSAVDNSLNPSKAGILDSLIRSIENQAVTGESGTFGGRGGATSGTSLPQITTPSVGPRTAGTIEKHNMESKALMDQLTNQPLKEQIKTRLTGNIPANVVDNLRPWLKFKEENASVLNIAKDDEKNYQKLLEFVSDSYRTPTEAIDAIWGRIDPATGKTADTAPDAMKREYGTAALLKLMAVLKWLRDNANDKFDWNAMK